MAVLKLLNKLLLKKNVTESASKFLHPKDVKFEKVGKEIKQIVDKLYGGRSLRIRAVDGGSANGEEIELAVQQV